MSVVGGYLNSIDRNLATSAEKSAAGGWSYDGIGYTSVLPSALLMAVGAGLAFVLNKCHAPQYVGSAAVIIAVVLALGHFLVVFSRWCTFDYERVTGKKLSDASSGYNGGLNGPDW